MAISVFLVIGGLFGLWLMSGERGDRMEDFLAGSNAFRPTRWPGVRHLRAFRFMRRTHRAISKLVRSGQGMEAQRVLDGAKIHSDRIRRGIR